MDEFRKGEAPDRKVRSDSEYGFLVSESIANPGEWVSTEVMEKHMNASSYTNMYSKLFRQVGQYFSEVSVSNGRIFIRIKGLNE